MATDMGIFQHIAAGLTLSLLAMPAMGETIKMNMSLGGIKAAEMTLKTDKSANRYSASVSLRSSGLVRAITSFKLSGAAAGAHNGRNFTSFSYWSQGSDSGRVEIGFRDGKPSSVTRTPARDPKNYWTAPKDVGRAIDPISAATAILTAKPADQLCNVTYNVYDGARASRIALGKPQKKGDDIYCNGSYSRVSGYSARQLEKGRKFNFTIFYTGDGNGQMRVSQISSKTTYGTATFKRR